VADFPRVRDTREQVSKTITKMETAVFGNDAMTLLLYAVGHTD
jgi:hypothetical protein